MSLPTNIDLQEAVRAIVAEGSGLNFETHVIPGNDDGPAPETLYATVLPIRLDRPGQDSYTLTPRDGDAQGFDALVVGPVIGRWSVQWLRDGALDAATWFHQWCFSPLGQLFIAERGLTFHECSEVRQIDSIISDGWERRAGLDFVAGYRQSTDQHVPSVVAVPLEFNTIEAGRETAEVT